MNQGVTKFPRKDPIIRKLYFSLDTPNRHVLFKENPCIPALFLVHERKLTETHEAMFKECVKCIPSLAKTCFPIVTDKERSIINAIKSELPGIKLLYCWNHIFRDVQVWCT